MGVGLFGRRGWCVPRVFGFGFGRVCLCTHPHPITTAFFFSFPFLARPAHLGGDLGEEGELEGVDLAEGAERGLPRLGHLCDHDRKRGNRRISQRVV